MRGQTTPSPMTNRWSPNPLIQSLIRRPFAGFLAVFALTIGASSAFNVDTRYPVVHTRAAGSQFGYSLAFYHSPNTREDMLIVGAPRDNSEAPRRDVRQSGAVYECQTDARNCRELLLDRTGNEHRLNGSRSLPISEKSFQLMGATVAASRDGSTILACAPHYKYFFSKFEVVEPVGTCFYGSGTFSDIREFSPCRQEPERHGYHRFGYGMCGFSAAIADEGERIFVGAPGNFYWQGSMFSQNVTRLLDRPNTPEGPKESDHQMMGYSTTVGDFDGDGFDDVVAGLPRGDELKGMVSIYTQNLRWIANLTDPNGQAGQYFGHSVAVVDVNNDGFDDVIVGAPFYTDYKNVKDLKTQEHKPQYEVGKVVVFLQNSAERSFHKPIQIIGKVQWARFGFSIALADDLNHDGYGDFVVGAPYENGHGAVYVFHGSKDGVTMEPTQKIAPADLQGVRPDLKTFGFSLTGGRDVDGNRFADIAVGAQESATAIVLRTKPVLTITGSAKTTKSSINLEDHNCETDKGPMACEGLKFCIQFEGEVDRRNEQIEIGVQIRLDSKAQFPRAFFAYRDLLKKHGILIHQKSQSQEYPDVIEQRIYLSKGQEHCEKHVIYVPDSIRDKINPIQIAVNYTYEAREPPTFPGYFEPAVDTTVPQTFTTDMLVPVLKLF
ncbi:hypothetical protein L596_018412 [Steinernema carpocapsae]|uniref:Integrin alpha first immunoglubulin-like domain-containing protein n=1 Tax=Steinernema carpocapsae TaxID=34508 RepID=A0A4U5N4U5_STECR|nr:hypothetical protein L596_018412 [Steinernema carpocapsae]